MIFSVIKLKIINRIIYILNKKTNNYRFEVLINKKFKGRDSFNLIQVGAHDGVKHDFLYDFLVIRKPSGILIEPIVDYYNSLCDNFKIFPNLIKLNIALHKNLKESIIYKVNPENEKDVPGWAPGSASFNKENLTKQKIDEKFIIEEKVKCMTFMQAFNDNYKFGPVDLIQIDVEGYDFEVIKMIDFNVVDAKIVKFEHRNLSSEDYLESLELFRKHNYVVTMEGDDSIAYKVCPFVAKIYRKFIVK